MAFFQKPSLMGYRQVPLSRLDLVNDKIYFWDPSVQLIRRANLNGSNWEDVLSLPGASLTAIEIDQERGALYWMDGSSGEIGRTTLMGTNRRVIIDTASGARNMALDSGSRSVYWVEPDRIRKARTNGTGFEDLLISSPEQPADIVIDANQDKIYWFDKGVNAIRKANLNGSVVEDLYATELSRADNLLLDPINNHLYWALKDEGIIRRGYLDVSYIEDVVSLGPGRLVTFNLDPDRGRLYFVDKMAGMAYKANLDGSNWEPFFTPPVPFVDHFEGIFEVDEARGRVIWLGAGIDDRSGQGEVIWRSNLDGSELLALDGRGGSKTGFVMATLSPEGEYLYALDSSINPPSEGRRLRVYHPEGNALPVFYDLYRGTPYRVSDVAFDWRYIAPPTDRSITDFSLINRDTGVPLPGYESFTGEVEIDLNRFPLPGIVALRANAFGPVESVKFDFQDNAQFNTDNIAPFTLVGSDGLNMVFTEGEFTLTAVPYAEDNGVGDEGISTQLVVRFVRELIEPGNLVMWNTLGSEEEVQNSRIGPGGTVAGGRFVEGKFGMAYEAQRSENYLVSFVLDQMKGTAGTIEFWGRLSGFPESIQPRAPVFAELIGDVSGDRYRIQYSGDGMSGFAGPFRTWIDHTEEWSYELLLGAGQTEEWHHYALVWDFEGIRGIVDGTKQTAVFVDGELRSGFWYAPDFASPSPLNGALLSLIENNGQGSTAIDNIKTWDYAKIDFSDRFVEGVQPETAISFTLIDAATDLPIRDYDPIMEGAVLDLSTLPGELSIRANVPERTEKCPFWI